MGTQITIKRLTSAVGAEVVGADLNEPLDSSTFGKIRHAFLEHCVLVFRGQFLQPEHQIAFTRRWGQNFRAPYLKQAEMLNHPEVLEVINRGKAKAFTTEQWHSDLSFMPVPPAHGILAAHVLPEMGGDTMFASQYVAYETLSDGMKRLLYNLRAWHWGARLAALAGIDDVAPQQSHPIVRTHPETRRKALFINRLYTNCIDGLSEDESRGLLHFLFEQICRPEFIYRHHWTPGDVVMWDNRCTVHYAVHDYGEAPRVLHRTTVTGDAPN